MTGPILPESMKARAYLTGVLVILIVYWLKVSPDLMSYIQNLTMTYIGGQTAVDVARVMKGKK